MEHISTIWKDVNVVFIPKNGQNCLKTVKGYKPIREIKNNIHENHIYKSQQYTLSAFLDIEGAMEERLTRLRLR